MLSAKIIAKQFNIEIKGEDVIIKNLGKLYSEMEKLLSFAETRKFLEDGLIKPNVCALVTKKEFIDFKTNKTLLFTENPHFSFYQIHNYLVEQTDFYAPPKNTIISKSAKIHKTAFISERNVRIGNNVIIGPNCTILENTFINEGAVIQAGTVIGSDGLEIVKNNSAILQARHGGSVMIGKNVEVGANCCIDKGLFREDTIIGNETKIANFVYIAHCAKIGERVIITPNTGIGDVVIGNDVWIGFGSIIKSGLVIDDNAFVSMGSIVTENVPKGAKVAGNFAIDYNKFIRYLKSLNKREY